MSRALLLPFLPTDISAVVKGMAPLKASDKDGFPDLFWQRYWPIIVISQFNQVFDLIDHDLHTWKDGTIRTILNHEQAELVLSILLPLANVSDTLT
ncbi:hypothetical protein V6N11_064726 [Hibiscus sabdariffa]|uniref:Uncharacterized protein n=2 Tax=Hibiscus sabdariffa TaxID=183260 RepID=A0ABR2SHY5_9ROSI